MRLSPIERDDLNDEQRPALEAIESGPRGKGRPGIGMIGPFGARVRAPCVGQAIQGAGEAIRFNTSLAPNVQEVAICTVLISNNKQCIRFSHCFYFSPFNWASLKEARSKPSWGLVAVWR